MTRDKAEKLARELSITHNTVAVAFEKVIYPYKVEYDATLEERYDGEEENVIAQFSSGILTVIT